MVIAITSCVNKYKLIMKRLKYRRGCLPEQDFKRHTGMDGRGAVGDWETEQTFHYTYHTIT